MKKILVSVIFSLSFLFSFSQDARVLIGQNGKLIADTVRRIYVDSPLYKPNDSTIAVDVLNYWVQTAANTIKHDSGTVTINNDTAAALANGSPALILKNNKVATSGNPQFTPALSLQGTTYNTASGGLQVPVEWRIFGSAVSTTGNGTSTLYFVPFINGVANSAPITMGSSGTTTFNAMTGNTVTATTFTGTDFVIGRKITGTYSVAGGVTSDAYWLSIAPSFSYSTVTALKTYRLAYLTPTVPSGNITSLYTNVVGYENTWGENRFNSLGVDRSGFGVGDSVNKSALVEMRSTTMGALIPRMTKTQRNAIISSLKGTISGGSGYALGGTGARGRVPLTGGSGTGAVADLYIVSGVVTNVWITSIGSGYVVGDVLSASPSGGGSGFTYTITEANPPADGLLVEVTGETGGTYLSLYNANTPGWEKVSTTAD